MDCVNSDVNTGAKSGASPLFGMLSAPLVYIELLQ